MGKNKFDIFNEKISRGVSIKLKIKEAMYVDIFFWLPPLHVKIDTVIFEVNITNYSIGITKDRTVPTTTDGIIT